MLNVRYLPITILLCILFTPKLHADAAIAFNFYPHLGDVNSDSDMTVNAAVQLPARFSYFSFVNFGGLFHAGSLKFQITEQNLRWQIADQSTIDLVIQDTIRKGSDNDTIHVGARWRMSSTEVMKKIFNAIHLNYSVHLFPKRFDQREVGGWQISHAYQITFPYISDRLYLSGFLDQNINEISSTGRKRDNIVSENQFGIRIFKKLYAVAEYRINQYRRSDNTNFGIGIEVKTNW
ncbi:MAG: hypothetical protein ACI9XC_001029 [Gammaproteobacteria bacterium]|jgi:hypothetical protein